MVSAACLYFASLFPLLSSFPFALTPSPSVAAPWGSFPCLPDVQAGLGMEAEAFFLLAFQEGKKLAIWAAVTCRALGWTVGMCELT